MTQPIHDKLLKLLDSEEPAVRRFVMRALELARDPGTSVGNLANVLRREVSSVMREDNGEN